MQAELVGLSEGLRAATSTDRLWQLGLDALARYGVTGICYAVTTSRRAALASDLTEFDFAVFRYPGAPFNEFLQKQGFRNDLTVRRVVQSGLTTVWHDESLWDNAEPEERRRALAEQEMGFRIGVTTTCSFEPGCVSGIGMTMHQMPAETFTRHWSDHGPKLQAITALLDAQVRRDHLPMLIGLTPREVDCLSWLAAGLRPDQIAETLGIGYRTVDKYIVSARGKLRARTRDQAVAKALTLRLIDP
ncbi:helix-turn-helix transcriptional regulator [Rhodobacter ferrooxidans]|uniref:Transcriptional regulator, LuxR family n=1 Tax=Rhodobacter ferrooxidans TaxID=371731 RepID=C8S075_9RHOB|nr:helix-turn-helix transcriptional regulator [Rhodobacter sp. SW2]EEW25684.1 transcriptional regulator, LuxR family [Rhodobacter sp. SW2]